MSKSPSDCEIAAAPVKIFKGSSLPPCCILCGEDSDKSFTFQFRKKTFGSFFGMFFFLFSPLYGFVIAREATISWSKLLPLCPTHWEHADRMRRLVGSLGIVAAAAVVLAVFLVGINPYAALGIVLITLLPALIFQAMRPSLKIAEVQREYVVVRSVPLRFAVGFEKANDGAEWAARIAAPAPLHTPTSTSTSTAPDDNPFGIDEGWRT